MSRFHQCLKIGVVVGALALVAVVPTQANAAPDAPRVATPSACDGLTSALTDVPTKAIGMLTALPPDPSKALNVVFEGMKLLTAAQGITGCLPPVPPTSLPAPGSDSMKCLTDMLGTVSGLTGTASTLTGLLGGGLPDVTGAVGALNKLKDSLASVMKCVPKPA